MGRLNDEENGLKSKQSKEIAEQGKVKWSVYTTYAKESNLIAVGIYFVALLAAQTAQIGGSFWLKRWSGINEAYGRNPAVGKYIGIYFAIGIGGAALVVVQVRTFHPCWSPLLGWKDCPEFSDLSPVHVPVCILSASHGGSN